MIDLDFCNIETMTIHRVGNQQNGELQLSNSPVSFSNEIEELLMSYFIKPFRDKPFQHLDLDQDSEVFDLIEALFEDSSQIMEKSVQFANRLMDHSTHQRIKTGEFFVVYFGGCRLDDELVDAIGLFKSEYKRSYLKVFPNNGGFGFGKDEGIDISKLDKGVLIFNVEKDNGYLVKNVDQKMDDYWSQGFVQLKAREDEYAQTSQFIQLCRDFAMEELPTENSGEKIGLVREAVNYFKDRDQFEPEDFKRQVIREPEIIEAFEDYSKNHQLAAHLEAAGEFTIDHQAVKATNRYIRSVIKLDKNFHIYVHGRRDRIERGYDESRALNYYRVFFEDEQ